MKIKLMSFLLLFMLSIGSLELRAQEAKFQALFMYKFKDYLKWPASSDVVTIGVYGRSEVLGELQTFAKGNPAVEVVELTSLADVKKCQIAFLSAAKSAEFDNIYSSIGTQAVLLVTEQDGYAEKGADVSFYLEGSKLRFKINKAKVEAKKIKVSGSLFAMATVI